MKVGIAITARRGLIVGTKDFPGNPFDGDTLAEQLEQAEMLSGEKPHTAIVDLGYRGRAIDGVNILHRGKPKRLTRRQWSWVKRRQAAEPVIGHLKNDCRLRNIQFNGALGEASHVFCSRRPVQLAPAAALERIFWASISYLVAQIFALPNREIGMTSA